MLEGRLWSYQTDIFCIAGTVHVMLFGEYMQMLKKFGQYEIKQKLPRLVFDGCIEIEIIRNYNRFTFYSTGT